MTEELIIYLALRRIPEELKLFSDCYNTYGSSAAERVIALLSLNEAELKIRTEKFKSEVKKQGLNYITLLDDGYPKLLREIYSPPFLLYYKGNIDLIMRPCVSIVGTRNPSHDGIKAVDRVIKHLSTSKKAISVVSGLALGIDTLVHKASLRHGCPAVAVLPSSILEPTPVTNINLAEQIIDAGGLIISENPKGYRVMKHSYLERNRIISGLSDRTLIVEAKIKSGSMSTANYAIEQNRDVYAVPGSISNPVAEGCNYLIYNGATPLIGASIFYDLEDERKKEGKDEKTSLNFGDDELLSLISEAGSISVDEIISTLEMEKIKLFTKLSEYELEGLITRDGNLVEYSAY